MKKNGVERKVKFSLIIPVFNCNNYLSRCLDSILQQDYSDYEVILVDDGSTDNSPKTCDEYSLKDERIVVVHKNNEGVSKARNVGLEIAKGKYISFLDSDDYLSSGYFSEIEKILKEYPKIDLINFGFYSDVDDIDSNNISSDSITFKEKYYDSKNSIKQDFVMLWDSSMLYNIWNKIYKKAIIDEHNIKFPKFNWGEDVVFNRFYLNCINTLYNSNKCFYHYIRERDGAVTKKFKPEIFEIRKNEYKEFNDYFDDWDINRLDYIEFSSRRYIERVLGCIENVYCSDMNFFNRYKEIKKIITDPITRQTLKLAKPKSIKVIIMLIPIRLKLVLLTMLMGRTFNIIKSKFPSLFNKLKNRR